MKRIFFSLMLVMLGLAFCQVASAQSLQERMAAAKAAQAPQRVKAVGAFGNKDKANFVIVAPYIKSAADQVGIDLSLEPSGGTTETLEAITMRVDDTSSDTFAHMGPGQFDVFTKFVKVNTNVEYVTHLYNYYGFLVVEGQSDIDDLNELLSEAKKVFTQTGYKAKVAVGSMKGGGRFTWSSICQAMPELVNYIEPVDSDQSLALDDLSEGKILAYFVMDAYDSPLIAKIKGKKKASKKDPKKQVDSYKLASNWTEGLKQFKYGQEQIYTAGNVDIPGWGNDVTVVTTPGTLFISKSFREKIKENYSRFREAVLNAVPNIKLDMKEPKK